MVETIADAVGIGEGTIYKNFKPNAESLCLFEFCVCNPQPYHLLDRLDENVVKASQVPEMVEELRKVCASNFARLLPANFKGCIADVSLENASSYFYHCAVWAFVHGALSTRCYGERF